MANTIKIKNSSTLGAVPSSLEHGEIAINYTDGKIFYKNNSNSIVTFGSVPSGGLEGQILSKTTDTSFVLQWIDNYTGDLRIICKNDSGVTINKGQAVMAVGAAGDRIRIAKAVANGSVSSEYMLGVASENISNSSEGYVQMLGEIKNIDTSAYVVGTVLYIDPDTPGALTSTKPSAPDLSESVAIVTKSQSSSGILFVRMWSQGESISTLHDVKLSNTLSNNDVLKYDGEKWINDKNISQDISDLFILAYMEIP